MLSTMLILFSEVTYCMASIDDVMFNNSYVLQLNSSQYCFVNESTISINGSDVYIINNTGDWIIADNKIYLFLDFANGTNCMSRTSDNVYTIFIRSFGILVAAAVITLHLLVKELKTLSGVLIVVLCVFIISNHSIALVRIALTNQRNGNVCAIMHYIGLTFYFAYDATKLSLLIQFAFLMYHSFKASTISQNKKLALCKYSILIVLLSVICSASVILVDVIISRVTYRIIHGKCTGSIDTSNASVILLTLELLILNFLKISFMIAGMVLYYLTTRRCCTVPSKDVKLSITLNCTIGINSFVVVLIHFFKASQGLIFTISSSTTVLELVLLFIVFFTSSKVLTHIHCTCKKE